MFHVLILASLEIDWVDLLLFWNFSFLVYRNISYDNDGNYLNSLNGISGEGLYIKKKHVYIVNEKDGITIVNVEDINNPYIVSATPKLMS